MSHAPALGAAAVVEAVEAHARNDALGRGACEKWGPRSSVSRVRLETPDGGLDVAVKLNRWRGLRGALSDLLRGSRAERARRGAALVAGIAPTPEPLAVVERRRAGCVVESHLLTRFVAGAEPLAARAPSLRGDARARRAALEALGDLLGRLHAAGVDHRDLKPSNVLVGPDGGLTLLDLDAVARRPVRWRDRVRALAGLEAYACDLAPWLSRSDRARFLRAYLRRDPALAAQRDALVRDVEARAARRLASWSERERPGRGHFPMAPRRETGPAGAAPLRIALVHPHAGDRGGVERQIHELALRLVDAGCEVHWVCRRALPDLDPAIRVHRVRDPARPLPFLRVWLFDRLASRAVAAHGPFDLVCGFGKTSRQDVYRDGSGCVADYRAHSGRRSGSLQQRVVEHIERERYRPGNARRVLAISELVRSQILRRHCVDPDRVEVLHPGVDLARFHPRRADAARAAVRAELGIAADAPLLAFVGSDFRRKGLDSLLAALPRLPGARLLVLGSDRRRARARVRRLARRLGVADRVHFRGQRSDPERQLAAADCLVFPSRFDAFGNAVLEAMATGLPVVVSRAAGASELVADGRSGRVVDDPEDAAALADAVRPFLDPETARAAGALARAEACRHSWDDHFARVFEIYRELAAAGRAADAPDASNRIARRALSR